MSFFIIQVQTNYERFVQKKLTHIFQQKKGNLVKTIYALDNYNHLEPTSLDPVSIQRFLHLQKVREQLNNMRYAYAKMKTNNQSGLKKEYKEQILFLTKELKKEPELSRIKNKTILKGYIIIELHGELSKIPSSIYYDIKSAPKVIGLPSVYNVPQDEIYAFTEQLSNIV